MSSLFGLPFFPTGKETYKSCLIDTLTEKGFNVWELSGIGHRLHMENDGHLMDISIFDNHINHPLIVPLLLGAFERGTDEFFLMPDQDIDEIIKGAENER